jgi:hypothetical protein
VKTIPNATTRMQRLFVTAQEAKQKDIECKFGTLQSRFHILTTGCRLWDLAAMDTVIRTCVLLHNLIIDYKRDNSVDGGYIKDAAYVPLHHMVVVPRNPNQSVEEREVLIGNMQNMKQHHLIQHNLMVKRWEQWIAFNGDDNHVMDEIDNDYIVQ